MRWISFIVITLLFATSAVKSIFNGGDIDKVLSGIFVIIIGTAWGANLWKTFIKS